LPETTGYRIKCSTVLWLLGLKVRRGRKVYTQVHTVNSNSRGVSKLDNKFPQAPSAVKFDGHHPKSSRLFTKLFDCA